MSSTEAAAFNHEQAIRHRAADHAPVPLRGRLPRDPLLRRACVTEGRIFGHARCGGQRDGAATAGLRPFRAADGRVGRGRARRRAGRLHGRLRPFIDPMTGVQRPVPYGFGLIRFDGADTTSITCSTRPTRARSGSANASRPCSNPARSDRQPGRHPPLPARWIDARPVSEQKIALPYVYTAGAAQRAALIGLREGRLVASVGGAYTCPCPPRRSRPTARAARDRELTG